MITHYRLDPQSLERKPVAHYRLNQHGQVSVSYERPEYAEHYAIDDALNDKGKRVTPADGQAFLDALTEQQWALSRFVEE